MTSSQAKKYVIGALVVGGVIAGAGDIAGGDVPKLRIVIGAIVAGVILAMIAEGAPELAASFALLILVGAVVAGGKPVAQKITALTAGSSTAGTTTSRNTNPNEHQGLRP